MKERLSFLIASERVNHFKFISVAKNNTGSGPVCHQLKSTDAYVWFKGWLTPPLLSVFLLDLIVAKVWRIRFHIFKNWFNFREHNRLKTCFKFGIWRNGKAQKISSHPAILMQVGVCEWKYALGRPYQDILDRLIHTPPFQSLFYFLNLASCSVFIIF